MTFETLLRFACQGANLKRFLLKDEARQSQMYTFPSTRLDYLIYFSADLPLRGWHVFRRAGPADGERALDREHHCRGELRGLCIVACRLSICPDAVSRYSNASAEHRARASREDTITRKNPRGLANDDVRKHRYQQHKSQEEGLSW